MSLTVSHNLLKKPIVDALFNSVELTDLIGEDSNGNESIYEGWHVPEQVQVRYPYLTYRINWFPTNPTGFLNGLLVIDVWDAAPDSNDATTIEEICTILVFIFDQAVLIDGLVIVRCRIQADEWVEPEQPEPGQIHRQISVRLRTIDLYSASN